jgi:hypothetical protein
VLEVNKKIERSFISVQNFKPQDYNDMCVVGYGHQDICDVIENCTSTINLSWLEAFLGRL